MQTPTARRPIRELSPTVASQIAAGEVIERPASVVKELIENAIDAGATRVAVVLEGGGIELIRVVDDGCGMPADELGLAVTPHATSKIRASADLDSIATLGFRGEALAAVASVARLTIRSRPVWSESAAVLAVDAGISDEIRPEAGPVGTSIEVRNLFHAVPARRKFLKTPQTERGRCVSVVRDLAIANPSVGVSLESDGRSVFELEPDQSPRERALGVLGRELEPKLIEVSADEFDDARGIALWGLVGTPEIARPTAIAQHVFVSGRPVRDRTIQHALREAYRGLMEHSRYPTAVLLLEMSPEAVDVNVHPAKAEVRFRDSGHVHGVVLRAVRDGLRAHDLTPSVPMGPGPAGSAPPLSDRPLGDGRGAGEPISAGAGGFVEFFTRRVPESTGGRLSFEALRTAMETQSSPDTKDAPQDAADAADKTSEQAERVPAAIEPARSVLQVHNSYVVTQDEDGVLIVDQHALHERVMFEYLMERLSRGRLESQALLTPIPLDAGERLVEVAERLGDLFETIGIEVVQLGPASLGVTAFPSFLFDRGVEAGPFVVELLETAAAGGVPPSPEEALRRVVDMMSCKAAVKAGDKLGGDELGRLLELREDVERSSSCPHGRPTSVRLTLAQLEKLFHRT